MEAIQSIQQFIAQNAWANQYIRVAVLLVGLLAVYFFLMSSYAGWIRKHIGPLRDMYTSKEVRHLVKKNEFGMAGEKLIELGEPEKAAEMFQEGKIFSRAGDLYVQSKNPAKAVVMYEKAGDLKKAGLVFLRSKSFDKLEELFQRNNRMADLATFYQENKKYERAADIHARINEYFRAAENYLQVGNEVKTAEMLTKYFYQTWKNESPELNSSPSKKVSDIAVKAGMIFEKNKMWDQALDLYKKIQDKKKIAQIMSAKGNFSEAASIAEETGDFRLASELHKKTNNEKGSTRMEAEHLLQEGDLNNAVEKFKEVGDYARCAEIYGDLQEYVKAAEMHELSGENYLAAKIFLDEKQFVRAGENFEKAQHYDEAAHAYKEVKAETKLLEMYDRTQRYIEMSEYFLSRKLPEQALAAIEKVPKTHESFRFTHYIRGRAFYNAGNYQKAQKELEELLLETEFVSSRDLTALHYLALAEQYLNVEKFKALEFLETKLAENKIDKNVLDKAMKIRQMIQDKSISRVSQSRSHPLRPMLDSDEHSMEGMKKMAGDRRYELIKEIGRGGMGVVHLAKDNILGREVALKILPTSIKSNDRVIQTFVREAKSAAALNHPNIVTVFDTGIQDGEYYIAMEHIDGQTIKGILKKKGKFSTPIIMELLKQLFSALEYAHSKMVIHRDLTTSNIMWTKQKLIKIMDFGLAKVIHNLQSEQSIIGGTPSFMSPEQTLGHPADHRTDIYSLGICIFEMCLGTLPFSKGDLGYHHLHTAPPIPKEIDPTIPQALNDAILKCLQKKPEDRFQNVREIAESLSIV